MKGSVTTSATATKAVRSQRMHMIVQVLYL